MAQTVCLILSSSDRQMLEAIVADRNRAQKHVERARVVLAAAERGPLQPVATRLGVSRPMVWRWQQRFTEEGADGLLRDKTRKPGKPPILAETVARVVALTCAEPPHEATHWTGRAMARAVGISLTSVQRIWAAHKLQPHRVRTFKRSRDPEFAAKLTDIVGLYMDPPTRAVVLSIDEKSQIQALDRTQPGLPIKPGRCGTMTHDYKRHGTTTLFAALNVLDGTVIGGCMQQHRHEEFIRFLNDVERAVPAAKLIEAVVDNYATHKHPKVKAWLERHPRWTFHFTPTSGSWLNAVENFFSVLTRKRIRRGSFHSVVDLQAAIKRYLADLSNDIGIAPLGDTNSPPLSLNVSLFDQRTVSLPRPDSRRVARAAAVKHGRRPPAKPARSVLDGGEHDTRLSQVGIAIMRERVALVPELSAIARSGASRAADSCRPGWSARDYGGAGDQGSQSPPRHPPGPPPIRPQRDWR